MAQSAELQLASATKSESYIGTRATHHSDSEMETVSIATFPSSAQHSSRSRSTEGVGVQNNKLFFSSSNIIATIMQGGILCSVVQVSAWVLEYGTPFIAWGCIIITVTSRLSYIQSDVCVWGREEKPP